MTTANPNESVPQSTGDEAAVWQPDLAQTKQTEVPAPDAAVADAEASGAEASGAVLTEAGPSHRRAGRASSVTVLLAIAALVAVGGGGFAAGRATATGQTGTSQTTLNGGNGAPGQNADGLVGGQNGIPAGGPNASGNPPDGGFGGGPGDGAVTGTVISVTATSITVQLANGQTVTIPVSSTTTYHTSTAASSSAVTTGSKVVISVSGDAGAAGSGAASDVTVTGN